MVIRGSIRPAKRTELDALIACDPLSAGDAARRAQIQLAIGRGHCEVWDLNGEIVGFVIMVPLAFFERDFVSLLVVSSTFRRNGVGSALMREAVEGSPRREVWTSTNESNVAMRGLLAREEWQFSGTLTGLDDGDPEYVYFKRRKLNSP